MLTKGYAVLFLSVVGLASQNIAFAQLNKCVDPATKKAYFTDSNCPSGSQREKSIGTGANSMQSNSPQEGNSQVARLLNQRSMAQRDYEKARVDYMFAGSQYTDSNAIEAALNKMKNAEKALVSANQAYLDVANPAQAAKIRQKRESDQLRKDLQDATDAANSAAANAANQGATYCHPIANGRMVCN